MRNALGQVALLFLFAAALLSDAVFAAAPANDDWADAVVIDALPFATSDPGPAPDLADATAEATDPVPPCLGFFETATQTVWYKYTTGASEEYVTLHAPVQDNAHSLTLIAVYSGSPGSFSVVSGACNDYSDDIHAARIAGLRLAPNATYSIEVVVVFAGGAGNALDLHVDPAQKYFVGKTSDSFRESCSNDCSLREAIAASNSNPGAVIVPAGTYTLSGFSNETGNLSGDLDLLQGMGIYAAGMHATIIDANHVDRIMTLDPHRTGHMAFAIGDLTMTHGNAPAAGPGEQFCSSNGGGLCVPGGFGLDDFVGLERVAVTANTAPGGGGGMEWFTPGTIRDSWIADNVAGGGGGGIDVAPGTGRLDISGTTISGNGVSGPGNGGGIQAQGKMTLVNTTISGNTTNVNGGGVSYFGTDGLSIASSTIVYNTAFDDNPFQTAVGGGLYLDGGTASIVNSIIAYNGGGDPGAEHDCYMNTSDPNTTLTGSYNLVQYPNDCPFPMADTHVDPKVLPGLIDRGGPTPTFTIDPAGPAHDGGDPDGCNDADGVPLAWDQRGPGFPRVDGPHCDIGAFEWIDRVFQNGFD